MLSRVNGLAVLAVLLVVPGPAAAGTLGTSGSTLEYRATPGEQDLFFPAYRRNRDFYWVQADFAPFANAAPSCSKGDDPDRPGDPELSVARPVIVSCPAAGVRVADVQLGDGNDKVEIARDETYSTDGEQQGPLNPSRPIAVHADAGPGNDSIQAAQQGVDILLGGPGDDFVNALAGDDLVRGGPGKDKANGVGGNDRLYGDSGADFLLGEGGRDRVYGGPGNDRLDGGGIAFGADRADRIYGGPGADHLADFQNGKESARDRFFGGTGNDTIRDEDGSVDFIDCGAGRDTVFSDQLNKVARNCERVKRKFRPPGS